MQMLRDSLCCNASTSLIRPITPAAASRCPRFVFTDPMTSGRSGAVHAQRRGQCVRFDRIAQGDAAGSLNVIDFFVRVPAFARARRMTASWAAPFGAVMPPLAILIESRSANECMNVIAIGESV